MPGLNNITMVRGPRRPARCHGEASPFFGTPPKSLFRQEPSKFEVPSLGGEDSGFAGHIIGATLHWESGKINLADRGIHWMGNKGPKYSGQCAIVGTTSGVNVRIARGSPRGRHFWNGGGS